MPSNVNPHNPKHREPADDLSMAITATIKDLVQVGRYREAAQLGEDRLLDFIGSSQKYDNVFLRHSVASVYTRLANQERSTFGHSECPEATRYEHMAILHLLFGLKNKPDDPYCLQLLGRIYLRTGENEKAFQCYQYLERIEPDSPMGLYGLWQAAGRIGRRDESERAFLKIAEISLESPQCRTWSATAMVLWSRARVAMQQDNVSLAAEMCREVLRRQGGPEEDTNKVNDGIVGLMKVRIYVTLAKALCRMEQYAEAIKVIDELVSSGAGNDVPQSSRDGWLRVKNDALRSLGFYEESWQVAEQLGRQEDFSPHDAVAMYSDLYRNMKRRCVAQMDVLRFSEAEETARELVNLCTEAPKGTIANDNIKVSLGLLAKTFILQKKMEEFPLVLDRIRALEPNDPYILWLEARGELAVGRTDEAFQMALKIYETYPFTRPQLNLLRTMAAHAGRNDEYEIILADACDRGLVDWSDPTFVPIEGRDLGYVDLDDEYISKVDDRYS